MGSGKEQPRLKEPGSFTNSEGREDCVAAGKVTREAVQYLDPGLLSASYSRRRYEELLSERRTVPKSFGPVIRLPRNRVSLLSVPAQAQGARRQAHLKPTPTILYPGVGGLAPPVYPDDSVSGGRRAAILYPGVGGGGLAPPAAERSEAFGGIRGAEPPGK
jgi:hypothetical protein